MELYRRKTAEYEEALKKHAEQVKAKVKLSFTHYIHVHVHIECV